ncbi:MAG: 6,7-dimethyl-8-ribityllumazine synthase [Chloroflexi bacterium]|nr:6,7-dimethyl-8-ribityllumazine synthase [Chloroflexota bacterium]MCZ6892003.1 6,7-dimethyl-8-ribityllumazine synthase [Chloroflexota bacterium]
MTSHREITGNLEGQGLRIGIVVARFNQAITSSLLDGAQKALGEHGVRAQDVTIIRVPGSFELPVAAKRLAKRHTPDAIVCLGAIIHHETDHDRYLAQAVSQSLAALARELEIPVVFGVLTTETEQQAAERAGGSLGNRGHDAALTAIEMATLLRRVDEPEGSGP